MLAATMGFMSSTVTGPFPAAAGFPLAVRLKNLRPFSTSSLLRLNPGVNFPLKEARIELVSSGGLCPNS